MTDEAKIPIEECLTAAEEAPDNLEMPGYADMSAGFLVYITSYIKHDQEEIGETHDN